MTYNVFGGTLSLTQSINSDDHLTCVQDDRSQFTFCELCACNF